MSIKLCRQSVPIMLFINAVGGEQLRTTAQSDIARERESELRQLDSNGLGFYSDQLFLTADRGAAQ